MKINNPVEVYKEKEREELWEKTVNKYRKYLFNKLDELPDFLKYNKVEPPSIKK